jgi:hypothetical protein
MKCGYASKYAKISLIDLISRIFELLDDEVTVLLEFNVAVSVVVAELHPVLDVSFACTVSLET